MIRRTGLLAVPRRLCYAIAGAALAGSLACSDGRPPSDAGPSSDPAVMDLSVVDAPGGDLAVADRAVDLDAPAADVRRDARVVVFPYECTNKDDKADVQPPCPEGEQLTDMFPPECPEGCRAVGLG